MKERQATSTGGKNQQLMVKKPEAEKQEKTTTRAELAKIAGVGETVLRKGTVILEKGTPEQIERARKGGKGNSVSAIAMITLG